jgi:bifunctional non-homologous end joining protein LigD
MAHPALPTITVMQAWQVAQPFHHEGWVYEEKYDGCRVVAYKDGRVVRLVSRNGRDLTHRFPELVAAMAGLKAYTLVLDGEVCRFDDQLVSRVEWLLRQPKGEPATPALYMVFDCLYARRKDLRDRALRIRRQWLEREVDDQRLILPARRLAPNGLEAWTEVLARGYEGLVGKDPASPYVGGRSLKWRKVKQPKYREGERGWEPRPAVRVI